MSPEPLVSSRASFRGRRFTLAGKRRPSSISLPHHKKSHEYPLPSVGESGPSWPQYFLWRHAPDYPGSFYLAVAASAADSKIFPA